MKTYIALIGDLVESKTIKDREQLQQKIKNIFADIYDQYQDIIVSKFMLTLGDEFQAILKADQRVIELIDHLQVKISYPFRLGMGYGPIATLIDPEFSIGADGEAFWNARKAIQDVYVQNWNGRCNILFKGSNPKQDELINTLFVCSETLKYMWTDKQKTTFAELLKQNIYQENFVQKEFAEKLNISESSLSKRLTSGNIKIYLHTRNVLGNLLEDYHGLSN